MASPVNSTKHLDKNQHQFFSNNNLKKDRREHFLTHSQRPVLPKYQSQTKNPTTKPQNNIPMDTDAKILNKILGKANPTMY